MTITVAAAGAGFLACVLWFDLMFDLQALRAPAGELPEPVLASICSYYARVTTAARPMSRLIPVVMAVTLAAIVAGLARSEVDAWVGWASLVLAAGPIALAGAVTVPSAVRLGSRRDSVARQGELARAIGRQHLLSLAGIAAVLALQIASA